MLRWLRRPEEQKPSEGGGGHRQVVIDHGELVQRALEGQREYLCRLAQMRQTGPMGHNPSEPIPAKADDHG